MVDGEDLDVEPGTFDAAISRLGLMYMPDKQGALAQARRALRDGRPLRRGRVRRAGPERVLLGADRDHPPTRGAAAAGARTARPVLVGALGDQLDAAGFRDVEVHRVEAPLELASAAECAQLERESFGALHQMLAGLPEDERRTTWREIEAALGEFETADGFRGPCELLVGVGTN